MWSKLFKKLGLQKSFKDAPWAFLRYVEIGPEEGTDVYLKRLVLMKTPLFGLFLHKFEHGDPDPHLHDHPWPFATYVLKGGYWEHTEEGTAWRGPGDFAFHWNNHKHRVILKGDKGAYTLFWHGPHMRDWGFYTDNGWEHWEQFFKRTRSRDEKVPPP